MKYWNIPSNRCDLRDKSTLAPTPTCFARDAAKSWPNQRSFGAAPSAGKTLLSLHPCEMGWQRGGRKSFFHWSNSISGRSCGAALTGFKLDPIDVLFIYPLYSLLILPPNKLLFCKKRLCLDFIRRLWSNFERLVVSKAWSFFDSP